MNNVLAGVAVPLNFDYKTVGVLGIIGEPKEVEPYAYLIKNYVEMMWQETTRVQIEDLEAMTVETFIQYILLNEPLNQEKIDQYCRMLHINPTCKRICILVDIGDSMLKNIQEKQRAISLEQYKKTLIDCVIRAFDVNQLNVCAFLNTEQIVLLKPVDREEDYVQLMEEFTDRSKPLKDMLTVYHINEVAIASGSMCLSIDSMNRSYREAEFLVKGGRVSPISIYTYYNWDVLFEILPAHIDISMQEKLLHRLNPFIKNETFEELAHNFMTYCSNNLNVSKAAKALFIHRNTLIYRLKKIETITGLDTGSFEHACFYI